MKNKDCRIAAPTKNRKWEPNRPLSEMLNSASPFLSAALPLYYKQMNNKTIHWHTASQWIVFCVRQHRVSSRNCQPLVCTHTDKFPAGDLTLQLGLSVLWLFHHQPVSRPVCWHKTSTTKLRGGERWVFTGEECLSCCPRSKKTQPVGCVSAAMTGGFKTSLLWGKETKPCSCKNAPVALTHTQTVV